PHRHYEPRPPTSTVRGGASLDTGDSVSASIEEIITRLSASGQKVAEAVQLLTAAENTAQRLQGQMAAAGVMDKAMRFGQVRESIIKTRQHLMANNALVNESINVAKSAGG